MSEATKISWWDETVSELGKMLDRKDARIAELERELASANELNRRAVDNAADFALKLVAAQRELAERPVVESDAAMELHGFLLAHPEYRWDLIRSWRHGNVLVDLILRFIASAPPTIAPSESERVRLLTEQLNAQAQSHAEEGERWSREMSELKCELEALKAAPARVEREVESELRTAMAAHPTWALSDDVLRGNVADETMRLILAGRAWLAAPLSAAPAQDEYTKAAVKYADEAVRSNFDANHRYDLVPWQTLCKLYAARQRGDARAAKVEPAPAEERVMVYAKLRPDGTASPAIWSELDRRNEGTLDGEKWLALTATVVREGGGEKGGAS